jgi:hypothetical protein
MAAATERRLRAWDALTASVLRQRRRLMEATLRKEGKDATEAARGAARHVEHVRRALLVERAQIEVEAVEHLN